MRHNFRTCSLVREVATQLSAISLFQLPDWASPVGAAYSFQGGPYGRHHK
jgi:hypothetical protein